MKIIDIFYDTIGDKLARSAMWAYQRPGQAALVVATLSVFSLFFARNLKLDADLVKLLPESFQSVQDLEKMKDRYGAVGYVAVIARGGEPEDLKRLARDISERVDKLEEIRYVDYRRPTEFFEEKALYYLKADKLEDLSDQLRGRIRREKEKANPLLVELDQERPENDLSLSQIRTELMGTHRLLQSSHETDGYYLDLVRKEIVVLARPKRMHENLDYAKVVVEQVQEVLSTISLTDYGPSIELQLAGSYTKKVDQQQMIESDLRLATSLAFVLILLYLFFYFRGLLPMTLVLLPLLVGVLWSFGFAGLAFGSLNILTGFVGAILLGLGIDHGIHLMTRFQEQHPGDRLTQIADTFRSTGRAALLAALTTMSAFLGVAIFEFRAFREFGLIAAAAMVFMTLAYTLLLPLGLRVLDNLGRTVVRAQTSHSSGFFSKHLRQRTVVFVLVSLVSLLLLPQLRFDSSFRSLVASDLPSFKMDKVIDRLLGHSQTPVVVLTESVDEQARALSVLRERQSKTASTSIDLVSSTRDLVPREQEDKQELIREIGEMLEQVEPEDLEKKERAWLPKIKKMAKATPFLYRDLPLEVRRNFQTKGGEPGTFVLVYSSLDMDEGVNVSKFAKEVRAIELNEGRRISAAGGPMIMADVFHMVMEEAPPVLIFTLVLVFLTSTILLGSIKSALLVLLPASATLLVTFGLLPITDIRINYLNVVMIPVLFGLGVDGGAHLVTQAEIELFTYRIWSDRARYYRSNCNHGAGLLDAPPCKPQGTELARPIDAPRAGHQSARLFAPLAWFPENPKRDCLGKSSRRALLFYNQERMTA